MKTIFFILVVYLSVLSLTHGYVLERNDCYNETREGHVDECGAEPFFKATLWPVYWIYHTGTLAFEPSKELNR